jgi:hypothetical protein
VAFGGCPGASNRRWMTCRIDAKGEEGGLFGGALVCGGTTASAHLPWILRPLGGGGGEIWRFWGCSSLVVLV